MFKWPHQFNTFSLVSLILLLNLMLVLTLTSGPAQAWVEQPAQKGNDQFGGYVLCKNNKIVRTIRIEKDDREWVAYYTKMGVDKEVARAHLLSSCHRVVENIKDNLTKANWKCKDLENVSATMNNDSVNE